MRLLPTLRVMFQPMFRKLLIAFSGLIFLLPKINFAEVNAANGEKLFKQYCTSCHKIDGKLVGPALKDVHKKQSEEWLIKWIRNNAALRASGDKDALAYLRRIQQE
jgi:cytochrome c2